MSVCSRRLTFQEVSLPTRSCSFHCLMPASSLNFQSITFFPLLFSVCLCASVYIKCTFLWAHPPPAFSLTEHLEHLILFTSLSFLPPALWLFSARLGYTALTRSRKGHQWLPYHTGHLSHLSLDRTSYSRPIHLSISISIIPQTLTLLFHGLYISLHKFLFFVQPFLDPVSSRTDDKSIPCGHFKIKIS